MKIPDSVNILGRKHGVVIVDKPCKVHQDGDADGYISHREQTIRVLKSLHPERRSEVFFHELVHGVITLGELEPLFKSEKDSEHFISLFSRLMLDTLSRNELCFIEHKEGVGIKPMTERRKKCRSNTGVRKQSTK